MKKKSLFVFLVFLSTILTIKGQNKDTSEVANMIHVFELSNFYSLPEVDSIPVDTTISFFHKYLPFDTLHTNQYLGSPGLAYKNGTLSFKNDVIDTFQFNKNLTYFPKNNSLIVTKKRITDLQYVLGSKKEQFLKVLHSQNIVQGLNVSIAYQRLSSEGFLRRQNTKHSHFEFFPWYISKSNNYSIYFSVGINDYVIEENGGVSSDTTTTDFTDLNLLGINLSNAENKSRKFSSSVYQKFNIFNMEGSPTFFKHAIILKLNYSEEKNSYTDSDPASQFYFTNYYDTSLTHDILKINNLNNSLKYTFLPANKISTSIYAVYDILEIKQMSIDTIFNNYIIGTGLSFEGDQLKINMDGEYCVSGASQGNHLLSSNLNFKLFNDFQIKLLYENKSSYPDLMFRIFQSNHFSWYNFFNKIESQNFEVNFHLININTFMMVRYLTMENYTFLNEIARPEQYSGKLNYVTIQLRNLLEFGKFGFESKGTWQHANNEDVMNLPEFGLAGTLYYESKLFKNALQTRTGIDAHYISSFTGDQYMPPLRDFYLQNESDIAGFTQFDFFINFKVKTARVFLKVQNITAEGANNFIYTVPGYPIPGRVFKLGINWMFFD